MKFSATSYLLASAICAVTLVACNQPNEALARATALHPEGRAVFEQYNCIRCHDAGNGGYGKRMIDNAHLSDLAFIEDRIVHGKNLGSARMPGFPEMPKRDLVAVAQFVRALAGFEK